MPNKRGRRLKRGTSLCFTVFSMAYKVFSQVAVKKLQGRTILSLKTLASIYLRVIQTTISQFKNVWMIISIKMCLLTLINVGIVEEAKCTHQTRS